MQRKMEWSGCEVKGDSSLTFEVICFKPHAQCCQFEKEHLVSVIKDWCCLWPRQQYPLLVFLNPCGRNLVFGSYFCYPAPRKKHQAQRSREWEMRHPPMEIGAAVFSGGRYMEWTEHWQLNCTAISMIFCRITIVEQQTFGCGGVQDKRVFAIRALLPLQSKNIVSQQFMKL